MQCTLTVRRTIQGVQRSPLAGAGVFCHGTERCARSPGYKVTDKVSRQLARHKRPPNIRTKLAKAEE